MLRRSLLIVIRRPPLGVNAVYAQLLCCSALLAQLLSTVNVVLLRAKDPEPPTFLIRGRWYLMPIHAFGRSDSDILRKVVESDGPEVHHA